MSINKILETTAGWRLETAPGGVPPRNPPARVSLSPLWRTSWPAGRQGAVSNRQPHLCYHACMMSYRILYRDDQLRKGSEINGKLGVALHSLS